MNTPAHLIFAAAAFARPNTPNSVWAAIAGGLAPDFSLYAMALWSRFVSGNSWNYIFDHQYFTEAWQQVFAIDNSFIIWGLLIALAFWLRREWLWIFAGSAFIHLIFDFLLHHDDARRHFWPVSNWVFESPVSYWDGRHYGNIVGPIEVLCVAVLAVILIRRFWPSLWAYAFGAIALLQVAPFIIFTLMFS